MDNDKFVNNVNVKLDKSSLTTSSTGSGLTRLLAVSDGTCPSTSTSTISPSRKGKREKMISRSGGSSMNFKDLQFTSTLRTGRTTGEL